MKNLRIYMETRLNTLLAEIPARQRPLLFIGLGLVSLLLVWLILLAPLSSARSALRREIAVKEQDLAWMRMAALEVRQYAQGGAGAARGASPLATIDGSARQFGLSQAMQRVEPVGGREVRVWLENAVFDDLLRWLAQLQQGHGIEVTEIVVEQGRAGSALTSVRLTLAKGD